MELVDNSFEILACGEPCLYHQLPPQIHDSRKTVNPKCLLHTLVRLLTSKISDDQTKRHVYLLSELKYALSHGFWLQDISNATKLIEILICKSDIIDKFYPFLIYLLELMRYAPLLYRSNEILDYCEELEEYFTFFGYILVTSNRPEVRQTVLNSLKTLLTTETQPLCYSLPIHLVSKHIERSDLPFILSKYLELCTNELYFQLIEILYLMASFSVNTRLIFTEIALGPIMYRLNPQWQEHFGGPRPKYDDLKVNPDYPLDDSIMLIFALLDTYKQNGYPKKVIQCTKAPPVEALWGLRYAFQIYTLDPRCKTERNFVTALWLLLIDCFPNGKYVQSGIVYDFAQLAKICDGSLGGTWASTVTFRPDDTSDFEFKRLLILSLVSCKDLLGIDKIYIDEEVLCLLTNLLDKNELVWAPQFHESLQITSIFALQQLLPICYEYFDLSDGPKKLLKLTRTLHAIDDYELQFEMFLQSLKFIWHLLTYDHANGVLTEFYRERQRKLQRSIFDKLFNYDFKLKSQLLMTQAMDNLSLLPSNDCANDIERIVDLFQRVLQPREKESCYYDKLIISAISLLWKHGRCNVVNYLYFVKLKGVYLLLDILKDANFYVQLTALGYFADLVNEGTAIPYFMTWYKEGFSSLQLLLHIFREENKAIGVEMLPRGIISDPKYPIIGATQRELLKKYRPDKSIAISDLYLSSRPRIYAIIQILRSQFPETVEIVDEYYKMYQSDLTTEDKITMHVADNYLVFKIGEIWHETAACTKPLNPTPYDLMMMDTLLNAFQKNAQNVKKFQLKWLAIENKNDHYTEEEFYNLLRESKLGPAIESLNEMKFLARTANNSFRKAYESLASETLPKDAHQTLFNVNNFFYAFNQKMSIPSDIIFDPFAPVAPTPVSEDNDSEISLTDNANTSHDLDNCPPPELDK